MASIREWAISQREEQAGTPRHPTAAEARQRRMWDVAVKCVLVLAKYDQQLMHMDPAQYTRFAEETFRREKALVEKLGLAKPGCAPCHWDCQRASTSSARTARAAARPMRPTASAPAAPASW